MCKLTAVLSCCCLCGASFARCPGNSLKQWTADEVRGIVERGTGVDYGGRDEMISFVGQVKAMDGTSRLRLEENICKSILEMPIPEHERNFDFVLSLENRRLLFSEISDFSFWRTNHVTMLRLADCLGVYCLIETNAFQQEIQKAYELDKAVWDRESERHERAGTVFVVKPGVNMTRVRTKFCIAKTWNLKVSRYRKDVLNYFLLHIHNYMDSLSPEVREKFAEEFIGRAKLTPEEIKHVFGTLVEKQPSTTDAVKHDKNNTAKPIVTGVDR